jgi:Ca2+-binding RTX toxin-like protein
MAGQPQTVGRRVARRVMFVALAGAAVATVGTGATSAAGTTELIYKAAPGQTNDITLVEDGSDLVITDTGATTLPRSLKGCTAVPVAVGVSARCTVAGSVIVRLELGDGDDHILSDMLLPRFTLDVDAGEGNDIIEPGDGNDRIDGGPGDDTLYGGYGNDEVFGRDGADYLNGSPGADLVDGGGGFDFMFGDAGADRMIGGGDTDYMFGQGGADIMDGGALHDLVDGGPGNDTLRGGVGDDELRGGNGYDVMDGEGGDDLLRGRDGETDSMTCGAGTDTARVDAGGLDSVHGSCERVRINED